MNVLPVASLILGIGALLGTLFFRLEMTGALVAVSFFACFCVAIALVIDDLAAACWLNNALQSDRPPTFYNLVLDRFLPWVRRNLLIREPEEDTTVHKLVRDTFTYRLLDRAMLLAVAYPVLLLLLYWGLSGRPGILGASEIIPAADPYWKGIAALCGIAIAFTILTFRKRATSPAKYFLRFLSVWPLFLFLYIIDLPPVAVILACGLAIASARGFVAKVRFVGAGSVVIAIAGAGVGGLTIALVDAITGADADVGQLVAAGSAAAAIAFAIAIIVAVVVAVAVGRLVNSGQDSLAALLAVIYPTSLLTLSLLYLPWDHLDEYFGGAKAVLMFFGMLPLINALFDAVSYGVTIALIERGRRGHPVLWGVLVDPAIALLLFLSLGAALVVVVTAMERLADSSFADLATLLTAPFDPAEYWWLYLMLFSTAIPTVLHGFLAIASLQSLLPHSLRNWIAGWIPAAQQGTALRGVVGSTLVGTYLAMGIVLPALLLWGIGWLLWHFGLGAFFYWYRDLLVDLFIWLAPHSHS